VDDVSKKYWPRDARGAVDTILWFIAGLAVLLAVVAGVLFLADLIWGQG
jgi:fatty acid desaturase